MFGETAGRFFRKDELALFAHFEHATTTGDQLDVGLDLLLDRLCQTGSLRVVVSDIAIFDRDFHRNSPITAKVILYYFVIFSGFDKANESYKEPVTV